MKASDLYFHVAPDFEELEDLMVYINPIEYWEEHKHMYDSFWIDPKSELAKEFEKAGLNSCETMEGVYELNYAAGIDDIQEVIARIESVGFKRNEEFSKFMSSCNEGSYIDETIEPETEVKPEVKTVQIDKVHREFEKIVLSTLKDLLVQAIKQEDYEMAARLRDEINYRKK